MTKIEKDKLSEEINRFKQIAILLHKEEMDIEKIFDVFRKYILSKFK